MIGAGSASNPVTVVFGGDALVTKPYAIDDAGRRAFVDLLRRADVAFTHLEILLNEFRGPPAPGVGIHLSTSPQSGRELLAVGFNLFSAAGNHALDYGIEGLRAHLSVLRELGMAVAGIGEDASEAAEPAFVDAGGSRVALIAAASSLGAGWPAAEFERGRLRELTLHPVTLGFGRPRGRRGQPSLASKEDARRILQRLDDLSRPFATRVKEVDAVGRVPVSS